MANIAAILSVGNSLASYLNNAYRQADFPQDDKPDCTFNLVSIGGVRAQDISIETGVQVVIFLYRVNINEFMRNSGRPRDPSMNPVPLSVDLHYLFSFWAQSADNEQLALAWTMRQLHEIPVLDGSVLGREAAWDSDEVIQMLPEEISNEDMMRIWDTLEPNYHLSLSYIARVVRIDPDQLRGGSPVVSRRFDYAVPEDE